MVISEVTEAVSEPRERAAMCRLSEQESLCGSSVLECSRSLSAPQDLSV